MYRNILVPLDGSELGEQALNVARTLAQRTQGRVHAVSVHDPSAYVPRSHGEATHGFTAASDAQHRASDATFVEQRAQTSRQLGVDAIGVVLEGTVVEALAEYAVANVV